MPDSLHRCWIFVNVEVMKDDIRDTISESHPKVLPTKNLKQGVQECVYYLKELIFLVTTPVPV